MVTNGSFVSTQRNTTKSSTSTLEHLERRGFTKTQDLHQQCICKEEVEEVDQQYCTQDRKSSLDLDDPEPPQIKRTGGTLHQPGGRAAPN
ncbi:hypothetical protein INR49_012887 [Caranx melampygus]|nr:hypothetical protein INR49_012887 [Caranx melampygus]